MHDPQLLLELIEECIGKHDGELGGWTRIANGSLQLFDGRVTLSVVMHDPGEATRLGGVHAHILTRLHDYDDETLDACVFGLAGDPEASLREAAEVWTTSVAEPIRSFLDDRAVASTERAGGDPSTDFGLAGSRAYVGPVVARGFEIPPHSGLLAGDRPWFGFAVACAGPKRVHLAKASIVAKGSDGWDRDLEIDGHEFRHPDRRWPARTSAPNVGYMNRFAVFELSSKEEIAHRANLERAIWFFCVSFPKHDSIDAVLEAMIGEGFDPDVAQEVETVSTLALGRFYFERCGFPYAPTAIRARRGGDIEVDVPLLSIPAYSRAWALASQLRDAMGDDEFQVLALHGAESGAIVKAIEAAGKLPDPDTMRLFPCVIPDRGVDERTMAAALSIQAAALANARAKNRPWWRLW